MPKPKAPAPEAKDSIQPAAGNDVAIVQNVAIEGALNLPPDKDAIVRNVTVDGKILVLKAELEAENAALKAENANLKAELAVLYAKLPKGITAKEGHKVIFIKSNGVAAIQKNGAKFIQGSVNGKAFEVQCDQQVEVADEIAEALRGVIEAQK